MLKTYGNTIALATLILGLFILLRNDIADLRTTVNDLSKEVADLDNKVASLTTNVANLTDRIKENDKKIVGHSEKVAKNAEIIANISGRLDKTLEEVRDRVYATLPQVFDEYLERKFGGIVPPLQFGGTIPPIDPSAEVIMTPGR